MRLFTTRHALIAAVALSAVAFSAPAAHAQYRARALYGRPFPVVQNSSPAFVPTQLQQSALRNYLYQTQVIGQAYASVPPWVYGYNPYPPVVNYGPTFSYPAYSGYTSPYSLGYVNPYNSGYVNPYSPLAPTPYGRTLNPYAGTSISPYGY